VGHLIRMEKWAENLDEVTVGEWLKREGDAVAPGEAVAELITEKATFQYTPEEGGVLLRILAEENSTVPVGYVIGFIGEPGEPLPEGIEAANQALIEAKKAEAKLSLDPSARSRSPRPEPAGGVIRATPPARRLARDRGVELDDVAAWFGDGRRIAEDDVQAYLERKNGEGPDGNA
jgi:pyruvate/2-oxoglutarate dehydrogenase complex dihydrolipoamide acyltransferase (E2) component